MLKRAGVLALILSATAIFLQPTAAFAEDHAPRAAYYRDGRDNSREVREYRAPVRDDRDWHGGDWKDRDARERVRIVPRYENGYYVATPGYYAPAPYCAR